MHFAWPSVYQAEQYFTQYTICHLFVLHFTQYLAFKIAFTISAPVNGGMSDWFIRAQILK